MDNFRSQSADLQGVVVADRPLKKPTTIGPTQGFVRLRERQQAAVAELGRRALGGASLTELFDDAVRHVQSTLGTDFTKILEYRAKEGGLFLRAGVGWKDGLVGQAIVPIGVESQGGYTFANRLPVVVRDLRTETRFQGPRLLTDHGVVSGISIVIGRPGAPWGVLGAHTKVLRIFTEDDVHFFQTVAHVLAEAIARRRARKALREVEDRLRLTQEATGVGSWDWDLKTGQVLWSDQLFVVYGFPPSSSASVDLWRQHVHPEDRERMDELIQSAIRDNKDLNCEYRFTRPDGEKRWLSAKGRVYYEDGEPVRMLGINTDVTSEKKTKERVLLSEHLHRRALAELEAIYNNTPVQLCVFDRELRVIRLNEAMLQAEGVPDGDYVGRPLAELLAHLGRPLRKMFEQAAQSGDSYLNVEVVSRGSGDQRRARCWLVSWVPVQDAQGTIDFFTCTILDITERKRGEKTLARQQRRLEQLVERRTQELVNANAALGKSRFDLRMLAERLMTIQEDRYKTLSRELHDAFSQRLAVLAMQIASLSKLTARPSIPFQRRLDESRREIEHLSRDIHELSRQLHPTILDDLGLTFAIRQLCETFSENQRISVSFTESSMKSSSLTGPVALCLYRMIQESLTSIAEHPNVPSVILHLRMHKGLAILTVTVQAEDFTLDLESEYRNELLGFKERLRQLGGTLKRKTPAGGKTVMEARVPIKQ